MVRSCERNIKRYRNSKMRHDGSPPCCCTANNGSNESRGTHPSTNRCDPTRGRIAREDFGLVLDPQREDFGLVLDPQQRQGSGNSPMPVELGHGLNGDSGCKANLPWGWFERFGSFLKEENKGDLFLDPAGYFLEPAAGKISGDGQFEDTGEAKYVWNVFLNRQVVFGGIRITEVPDKPSNFACDAEDQKCNVCLSSIRGLPDDFNKELIHGQSADCTPEEIQACRQRLTAKGIPIP